MSQKLMAKLNKVIVKQYPELEDLEVTPSLEQQKFRSDKYGYNEVTVNAIETENLDIVPSMEEQNFDGVYKEVKVQGIPAEEITITPSPEEQVKEGLYKKVNVNAIQGENLIVTPSLEEQVFNGVYTQVNVGVAEGEDISIMPSAEEQVKEGLFSKVTVSGDSNLLPKNIKKGVSIFGVNGTAEGGTIVTEGVMQFATIEEMNKTASNIKGDVALVYKTWGVSVTESGSFNGQNAIYFPKTVVSEVVAKLPITGSNLFRIITQNATVVITITEQNVSFNVTCEAYPMLDKYTTINIIYTKTDTGAIRTEINDGTGNVIEDTYDYIYVNTGGGTNWSSFWTDDINQFWHKITGKVIVGLYKFENEWIELPLAYSASAKDVSWSTLGDNVRYDNSNTFLGNNGFENGTLGKKGTITEDNWQTSLGITVSNNLQAMIDKLPDTNYSSSMQKTLVGFPVRSDGTSVIKFPSSTFSFNGNNNISYIPALDLGSVTNLYQSFIVCKQLLGVGKMNTSNVTNMRQTFMECSRLEDVAELDASKVTNMTYMFNLCPNLTDESLNNIMAMCSKATTYISRGSYLTLREMGLSEEQVERCKKLSNYSACISAGWTTGY